MKNQQKFFGALGIVVVLLLALFLWQLGQNISPVRPIHEAEKKLTIVTTFYPLQEFARSVGGERVTVSSIVPAGVEPHDYEPTPQDIVSAYQADVFLLNGAGMDGWAEKIRPELERRGVVVVQMSEVVQGVVSTAAVSDQGDVDPHFWLDPVLVRQEVEVIRDVLVARDPQSAALYQGNTARYMSALEDLDGRYREGLRQCTFDTIVTSHDAFGYLAKRYGFKVLPVSGISAEAEPSPRALADIAETMQSLGLRHIFFETLVSPKIAETLAAAVGAETLVLDPLEGLSEEKQKAGKNYLSVMAENLHNLETALVCQQ
jgi:zinc transport system substrate-binding protein